MIGAAGKAAAFLKLVPIFDEFGHNSQYEQKPFNSICYAETYVISMILGFNEAIITAA